MPKEEKNLPVAPRDREQSSTPAQNSSALGDLKEIKDLIDLIIEKDLSEFELERAGVRVKITRHTAFHSPETPVHPAASSPAAWPVAAGPSAVAERAARSQPEASTAEELSVVRSPMVGTFYASPAPGAELFVRAGDIVQVGQVLCIIEAMKLMNEIEAETAGEVIHCHVENGQPVEYGEPLFEIRPSSPGKGRL